MCSLDDSSDDEGLPKKPRAETEQAVQLEAKKQVLVEAETEASSGKIDLTSPEWSEEACRALLLKPAPPAPGPGVERVCDFGPPCLYSGQTRRQKLYRLVEREFGHWAVQIVQSIGMAKRLDRALPLQEKGQGSGDTFQRGYLEHPWEARQLLWELKRYSRKRGRDDAMLHQSMLLEAMAQINFDGTDKDGRPFLETLAPHIKPFLSRIFQPRISEMQDLFEWGKGWKQVRLPAKYMIRQMPLIS